MIERIESEIWARRQRQRVALLRGQYGRRKRLRDGRIGVIPIPQCSGDRFGMLGVLRQPLQDRRAMHLCALEEISREFRQLVAARA